MVLLFCDDAFCNNVSDSEDTIAESVMFMIMVLVMMMVMPTVVVMDSSKCR